MVHGKGQVQASLPQPADDLGVSWQIGPVTPSRPAPGSPARRWSGVLAAVALLASGCSAEPPAPAPASVSAPGPDLNAGWQQVTFEDDFSGSRLDRAKWSYEEGTFGDGNQELACLTDRPENVSVSGGRLQITARRESRRYDCGNDRRFPNGRRYTSGMLLTRDTFSQTYGRFELLGATMPAVPATGTVPAFWLRPVDGGFGEIDIVEVPGSPDEAGARKVHAAAHHDYDGLRPHVENDHLLPPEAPTVDAGPHDYAVEWEPTQIRWYVDGKNWFTLAVVGAPLSPRGDATADRVEVDWFAEAFAGRAFFLRINLAVGGSWAGAPPEATSFPAVLSADGVRVTTGAPTVRLP